MSVYDPHRVLYDEDYFMRLHKLNRIGNNLYREKQRLETIENLCEPSASDDVLELGCGTGLYTRLLAPRVKTIVGVDFSVIAIEKAISQGKRDNCEFRVGDIRRLDMFPDQAFDKVLAIDVLEHLSDSQLEASLHEVVRLLKKDGIFVFFTPCRSHWIEWLKDKSVILKQFEEHIGVRTEAEYCQIIQNSDLYIKRVLRFETCIPVLRVVERILKNGPVIDNLFVSRLAMVVSK